MQLRHVTTAVLLGAAISLPIHSGQASSPDGHAPIGVMGDHLHKKGEWMTSYRYMQMHMKGNRDGSDSVTIDEVHNNFMVAPVDMQMDMHMFGLMYAPSDKVTMMAMIPYVSMEMDHVTRMGQVFTTKSDGLGDIKLTALVDLYQYKNAKLHANVGLSFPTGSMDERDDTPAMSNAKLPYPMQIGSGTYDPLLGLTFVNYSEQWSWGSQLRSVLRFGKNNEGYRLGHRYGLTGWVQRNMNENFSLTFRLDGQYWKDVSGTDNELNPMMVPTARADLRGGKRIDALVGVNYLFTQGTLKGNRLAFEVGRPVYQHLDGPQLETDTTITLGWQLAF